MCVLRNNPMADLPVIQQVLPPARVEEHPVAVYLARLTSPQSRRTMRSKLDGVARLILGDPNATAWDVPWAKLDPIHLDALRSIIAERNAPSTGNCILAAVRGVLKACWRLGQINAERLARLLDVEPVRGSSPPTGRSIETAEIRALFEACYDKGRPNASARDAAVLALLYGAGLRRAELAALDVADVDRDREEVVIRRGKGNKARIVPLALGAADYVSQWLSRRSEVAGPLLLPVNKGDAVQDRRMGPDSIGHLVKRLCARAGVKDAAAHDFRRTLIGDLLDAGADLATVQQIAGHASPTTTSRYERRPAEARRRAARLVRVPRARPMNV
jgi:integrase